MFKVVTVLFLCKTIWNNCQTADLNSMQSGNEINSSAETDFEPVLKAHFGDEFALVNYTVDNLVPRGENFRSIMLKVDARVQRTKDSPVENLHFVAKTVPTVLLEMVKNMNWNKMFMKEIFMYVNIIPFYVQVEKRNDFDEESIGDIVPKLYGHRTPVRLPNKTVDKSAVLLMENLKVPGYYVVDKKIGLDLEHSTKAIKPLAHFHALGIAAKSDNPDAFEPIKSAYPNPDYDYLSVDPLFDKFVEAIESEPSFLRFAPRVRKIADRQRGGWKPSRVTSDLWSTIIHFDFWINNVMFHKDPGGNVDSVKILDFQTYCFADVFLDLAYFLGTSLNDEVKLGHVDELLDVYYERLISVLEKLGVDVEDYSREKFDERFREVAAHEFLHSALVLNFFTGGVHEGDDDKQLKVPPITFEDNELYYKKIMLLLQIYEDRDWLH